MTTDDTIPTMAGFDWSPVPPFVPKVPGENGWCVRDAICELFGWEPGSENWSLFIEAPDPMDTPRLAERLGLTLFSIVPQDWNELITRLEHPGIAIFVFDEGELSHTVYVHDVAWLMHHWPKVDGQPATREDRQLRWYGWPLGMQYMKHGPVLGAVLINEHEPPHAWVPSD